MLPGNATSLSTQCKPRSYVEFASIIFYILTFVIGLIGNSFVLFYFGFKKKSKQKFDYYLIHLAIADEIASVITSAHNLYVLLSPRWKIGTAMCKIISSVGPLTVNVSAWIVTSIAIERCRGISTPYKERFGKRRINTLMICIWTFSALALIPYISVMQIQEGHCNPVWKNPTLDFSYSVILLLLQSIMPMVTMLGVLFRIIRTVSLRYDNVVFKSKQPPKDNQSSESICKIKIKTFYTKKDQKLFKTLLLACAVFIICTLPYNVFYTTVIYSIRLKKRYLSQTQTEVIQNINNLLSSLVVINSCVNVFIYTGLDKGLMVFLKSIIMFKKPDRACSTKKKSRGSLTNLTEFQTLVQPNFHSDEEKITGDKNEEQEHYDSIQIHTEHIED